VGAILRLECARTSVSGSGRILRLKGDLLSAVSEEINCVFLHLLENPRLCDRRAVEIMCTGSQSKRFQGRRVKLPETELTNEANFEITGQAHAEGGGQEA
jgi:hypothetical protein